MKNIYVLLVFSIFCFMHTSNTYAQKNAPITQSKQHIEGLSVFPNPVNNNASSVYITSRNSFALKNVIIYNVLGKQIKASVTTKKELDISSLNSGVYILKITEGASSETRKLVIK